jgi:hypothetical protein
LLTLEQILCMAQENKQDRMTDVEPDLHSPFHPFPYRPLLFLVLLEPQLSLLPTDLERGS